MIADTSSLYGDGFCRLPMCREHVLEFQNDSSLDLQKLSAQLVEMGYEKMPQVEAVGQFAIRGGIVDVFPLTEENPHSYRTVGG